MCYASLAVKNKNNSFKIITRIPVNSARTTNAIANTNVKCYGEITYPCRALIALLFLLSDHARGVTIYEKYKIVYTIILHGK